MKKLVATVLLTSGLLAAAALPASAGVVDDTTCALYAKIGVVNVRECGDGNPDS